MLNGVHRAGRGQDCEEVRVENRVSGKRAMLGSRSCGAHEGYLPRILLQLQDEGEQFPGEVLLGVFHFF